jgi:5-methylcytosine-specific restriction enzyme A
MPTRLCLEPKCAAPATYRGRCAEHARTNERNISRSGYAIYRTAKWRHTRNAILSDNPLCPCGAIATDVHHRVDLADGGDPWARTNLEALCHPCHSRLTRRRGQQACSPSLST